MSSADSSLYTREPVVAIVCFVDKLAQTVLGRAKHLPIVFYSVADDFDVLGRGWGVLLQVVGDVLADADGRIAPSGEVIFWEFH